MTEDVIITLPDNGRSKRGYITLDRRGYQIGTVRTFFMTDDPERPGEQIADYTYVLTPEEVATLQRRGTKPERFLYHGKVYER